MLHRHKKINKKELRFYRWGKPELAWNPLSTEEVKKKKRKEKSKKNFFKAISMWYEYFKKENQGLWFLSSPLVIGQVGIFLSLPLSSHLCRVNQIEGKHLGKLQTLLYPKKKKKKNFPKTPLLSLSLVLRLIWDTGFFWCWKYFDSSLEKYNLFLMCCF